jgi:hypothetical protein
MKIVLATLMLLFFCSSGFANQWVDGPYGKRLTISSHQPTGDCDSDKHRCESPSTD